MGDVARFGVKEMTSFFITSLTRLMTRMRHLQTAVN